MADKLSVKPYHRMTRFEAVVALRELHQQFSDFKFHADQRIKDLEGEIAALIECEKYQPAQRDHAKPPRRTARNAR